MSKIELPPLANISPKDCIPYGSIRYIAGYSEEYVKQYARARDRQIVELCASVVESANNYDNPMTANDCADAIRSLLDPAEKETSHGA